ncbi:MAG: GNAT family N-acetyltransferase [Actinobacteria bacterium]|nr:GNAT family N-acetyltransferase [Actinomycetota bacterium]MCG2807712.1 GNAT family N-acetyltransferase [Coriobacteriia bacterium]
MGTHALRMRLEGLVVAERAETCAIASRRYPDSGVYSRAIGSGIAVFGGSAIGLSSVSGLGDESALTERESAALREFLDAVGERPVEVSVPVGSDPETVALIASLGMHFLEFEDVLVLDIGQARRVGPSAGVSQEVPSLSDPFASVEISDDADRWAELVARGFNEGHTPPQTDIRFARCIAERAGVELYWARSQDTPVAAGELWTGNGVAWLSADVVLPKYRGRGLQVRLQEARLAAAERKGCALAVTEAVPGYPSHRHAGRLGFRVAYSRMVFARGGR